MLFQNKNENFRKTKRRAKRLSKDFFFRGKWEIQDTDELAENILV